MNKKKLITVLSIVVLLGLAALVKYFNLLPYFNSNKPEENIVEGGFGWKYPVAKFPSVGPAGENLIAYSTIRDPGGIPKGLPVRLKIPAINVDSAIEDAYITADGRMDVPAGTVNVAWFALGPHPGQTGSAVIGGHFGRYEENKGPTVFFNLDKLKAGDKIYIEDDKGDTLAFVVRKIELFDRNADSTSVFTSDDGLAHLNLITCEGVWNKVNDNYPDRRVVFTEEIPYEGPIEVSTNIPAPALPKTAVAEPSSTPTSTPEATDPVVNTPTVASSTVSRYMKILFGTPMDATISSLLIISITGIVIKVIRK